MDDVLATVEVRRRRFTVNEYDRMGEVGILTENDRVELIDGEIIQMSPIGSRHGHCISTLTERLLPALVGRAIVRPQLPLFISSTTQPQPDVLLVKPGAHYWTQQPRPEDVLLVVEVAETSYSYDRDVKLPLYAGENIPEVWIIDLVRGAVEVYREPSARRYQLLLRLARGATLAPAAFPDVTIAVTDILPPA